MNLSKQKYMIHNLFSENLCAVVNKNSPEAELEALDLYSRKMKRPLLMSNADNSFMENLIPSRLFDEHRNPEHSKPVSLNSMILSILNGTGWAILPEHLAARYASHVKILPLQNLDTLHYITICWRAKPKNQMLNKLAKTIIAQYEPQ